ncbi:MAG: AAA family ATPase [Chloroflexi bacterium]|nr:AAA family ATPase [Chloroflexota bacterium]
MHNQVLQEAANQRESARLLQLRLTGFVGREAEQAAIRELIDQTHATGGYVLVTGEAGAGKSSLIAQLIVSAGLAQTPQHFIALTPGRAYQLDVLRSIVAQLMLKHDLTDRYFPADSYPALRLEFGQLLQTLSARGISETIYLDGLDQLQPEVDGTRDLSFLPLQLPPGIVMVLGSRPKETIASLALEHGVVYQVPPLREQDAIGRWQQVQPMLEPARLHGLAQSVKGNALLVELAATVLRHTSTNELPALLNHASADATNLFRLSLGRIEQAAPHHWQPLIRSLLAVLVVTQEPLEPTVLAAILEQPVEAIAEVLPLMGDWVSVAADQRVALRHLLFHDFLQHYEFAAAERRVWHGRMAQWCGAALDQIWQDSAEPVEQARRWYARQHYITHLAYAEQWGALWQVIDVGEYGEHKVRFEPSTRLYGLDLDRARESVIAAGQSIEQQLELLPRLWRYSLLRTSLTAHADRWRDYHFVMLAMLGRVSEALAQLDICSNQVSQVRVWSQLLPYLESDVRWRIFQRMEQTARSISDSRHRDYALYLVAVAYADYDLLKMAYPIAISLGDSRDETLAHLIDVAIKQHDLAYAQAIIGYVQAPAARIKHALNVTNALIEDAEFDAARHVLAGIMPLAQAEHIVEINSLIALLEWRLGNQQQALALLDEAQTMSAHLNPDLRSSAWLAVIKSYVQQGDLTKATSLHRKIQSVQVWCDLIMFYRDRAEVAIATELAIAMTTPYFRDSACFALVEWYCTHAEFADAQRLIELIGSDWDKVKAYCLLASSYAQNLQFEQMLAVMQLAHNTVPREREHSIPSLLVIADTYARHNLHEQARSVFEQVLALFLSGQRYNRDEHNLHFVQSTQRYGYLDLCEPLIQRLFTLGEYGFDNDLVEQIAKVYAEQGELAQAAQIIQSIDQDYQFIQAAQGLVLSTTNQQQSAASESLLLAARQRVAQINPDGLSALKTLCELADTALQLGLTAIAQTLLSDVDQALLHKPHLLNHPLLQYEAWLLKSYQAQHKLASLVELARLIDDPQAHDQLIAAILEAYLQADDVRQAYQLLRLFNDFADVYAKSACKLAIKASQLGLTELATQVHPEAISACETVRESHRRFEYLRDLAVAQINYGDAGCLARLLQIFREQEAVFGQIDWYIEALCAIAVAFAEQCDAVAFADWLNYAHKRATAFPTGYQALAETYFGYAPDSAIEAFLDSVEQLVQISLDQGYADTALEALAKIYTSYAAHGHAEFLVKAHQAAISIPDRDYQYAALVTVAQAYLKIKAMPELQVIISELSQLGFDFWIFQDLTASCIEEGELYLAYQLILFDERHPVKDEVICNLIARLIQADQPIIAYQLTSEIYEADNRAGSLQQIIHYYLERQQITAVIKIIQTTWRDCQRSYELWQLGPIIVPLIPHYPWLGTALLDSVPWLEQQLARLN